MLNPLSNIAMVMDTFGTVRRSTYMTLVLVVAVSLNGFAQAPLSSGSVDSLVARLSSPDWRVRDDAISRLNRVPANRLPAQYAATAIPLLEREAVSPDPHSEGEGYGEYLIHLMRGVLRLRDPRSLRGMSLLGIQMSSEAKKFVASYGQASVPFLDEAWSRGSSSRHSAAITWAHMLGTYRKALTRPMVLHGMAKILTLETDDPLALTWVARTAPLPELVPAVETISAQESSPLIRRRASTVLTDLRAQREQMSPGELLNRMLDWLDAACLGAAGGQANACQSLSGKMAQAKDQAEARGLASARATLQELLRSIDAAPDQLTQTERRLLRGNLEYLAQRSQ